MSQGEITSILLPAARVDFFALDDQTAATAEKLAADWRFARVNIQVNRGGMDAAIAAYAQAASPELIMIETNDISEAFIQQLGGLAGVCAEGTDAVIIGPTNDVHLYRNLVGMGVRDYLVRPVAESDMVSVIAKALVEKRGLANSRLVTVLGSKGGVGTTAIAQMLAWIVSGKLGEKTVLLDAAGSIGSMGVVHGLEPLTSLTEAVRVAASGSEDDMKRIMQKAAENLSLLFFGNEPVLADRPDPDSVEALVNRLLQKYPVAVMDLSSTTHAIRKRMLARSSAVVIVSTPLLSSLRNTRSLMNEIKTIRGNLKDVELVVNMAGLAGSDEVPAADLKQFLEKEPVARLGYLPKVFISGETTGKPPAESKGADAAIQALMKLAEKVSGTKYAGQAGDDSKGSPFDLLKKTLSKVGK